MRRRDFIKIIAGSATSWPFAARAQQAGKIWRIGMLDTASRELNSTNMDVFLENLREYGYVEGKNLIIDYRSAGGRNEGLPILVSQLIALNPDVIVLRGTLEALAVKNATSTIPVVMSAVVDPVAIGGRRLALASRREFHGDDFRCYRTRGEAIGDPEGGCPRDEANGSSGRSHEPRSPIEWKEVQIAARSLMIDAILFDVRHAAEVSHAFDVAVSEKLDALLVRVDGTTRPNRQLIIDLAAIHKLPAIYSAKEFIDEGGLICLCCKLCRSL